MFCFLCRVSTGDIILKFSDLPGWYLSSPGRKHNRGDFSGGNDGCYSSNGVPSRNRRPSDVDRSGRADDEGSDLLLNSDRGAGGAVVSKEEVAAG
jgi:hypothetical protein